jgi:hypothetical protein
MGCPRDWLPLVHRRAALRHMTEDVPLNQLLWLPACICRL